MIRSPVIAAPVDPDLSPTADTSRDSHTGRLAGLAVLASLSSFYYYFQRGDILTHGDAVAHINIARRLFDSLTPGPLALGTVWLPLPHILMAPFVVFNKLWQNGVGGSIPSMIAYVFGVLGIFRLVQGVLQSDIRTRPAASIGGFIAALAYGANPNLIYTQTTALTEPLYLAFFIWALVYFADFVRAVDPDQHKPYALQNDVLKNDNLRNEEPKSNKLKKNRPQINQPENTTRESLARRSLRQCAYCLACAELTRYDGWFVAGIIGLLVVLITVRQWLNPSHRPIALKFIALKFLAAIAVAPSLWLVYNAVVYGNALAFANGPYSAKAIELRVGAPNPGFHNPWVAGLYFLKSAQITLAVGNWGRFWLLAAVIATLLSWWVFRRQAGAIFLLLWAPVAFYSYSISYGWVPLHVPMWWPFAVFNQRFGLELLPLFAAAAGLLVALLFALWREIPAWTVPAVAAALILVCYAFVLHAQPLDWLEASRNWEMRRPLDTSVERAIKGFPLNSRFMMDLGEHVGIMERLGIPLRRVVNGDNRRPWIRPTDPQAIWERALVDPARYVNYVIAFEGDSVDRGVNRTNLNLLMVIHSSGQPPARIYATTGPLNQSR